jgi:hypothetical protein
MPEFLTETASQAGGDSGAGSIPTQDLKAWYDASKEGLADGAKVAQWTDQSGLGNHATQSNAALRPTFKTNVINQLPALLFNPAAAERLSLPSVFNVTGALTLILVVRPAGDTQQFFIQARGDAGENYRLMLNGDLYLSLVSGSGPTVWAWPNTNTAMKLGKNVWHIVTLLRTAENNAQGQFELRLDGSRYLTSGPIPDPNPGSNPRQILGTRDDGANPFSGHIAEVLLWHRRLKGRDLFNAERFLSEKYGL